VLLCDKKEEADFAVAYLKSKGLKNIQVNHFAEYKVYEIEGNAPSYSFAGKYGHMGETFYEVRAEQ
jgi:hypothetical protein